MVWLYLPLEAITRAQKKGAACSASRSVRAQVDSTSASILPCQTIELFVTLSGKATPHPLSWRGWKTRPWIARLSGTTLPTSTAKRGAAWWISSTAAIHASRSLWRGASSATKTRVISGRTSRGSSVKSNRQSVSLKTSADIYDWDLNKSTMTFEQWVIALRRACLHGRSRCVAQTGAALHLGLADLLFLVSPDVAKAVENVAADFQKARAFAVSPPMIQGAGGKSPPL